MIYEKEKRYIIPFVDVPSQRAEMPEISVDERRGNYTEVETGFPEDMAIQEAKRCLSCRRCLGCALCWAECKPEAIDFEIPDEDLELEFNEVVITKGQENAFYPFNAQLGYGSYPEVITDIQFEHMLSPTGPTKGMVLSPLDGEVTKRLAIVDQDLVDVRIELNRGTGILRGLCKRVHQLRSTTRLQAYGTTKLAVQALQPGQDRTGRARSHGASHHGVRRNGTF